jgi:hypothetical protein
MMKSKKSSSKDDSIPFDDLKEGSLKRMLKIKKDDKKMGKAEVNRLSKIMNGETFTFRDNKLKMTPLMKKRVSLAKTMMKF